jgi:transcriptional regulator with XRE-family HTH domain
VILLRRVLGDALRARRQAQHRTLREVSGAANVSLGYLSEIERGQKEASSELLSAICDALGAQLSEVLRDVTDTMELAELTESGVLAADHRRLARAGVGSSGDRGDPEGEPAKIEFTAPPPRGPNAMSSGGRAPAPAMSPPPAMTPSAKIAAGSIAPAGSMGVTNFIGDGAVAVAVHREGPFLTALLAARTGGPRREVVHAA